MEFKYTTYNYAYTLRDTTQVHVIANYMSSIVNLINSITEVEEGSSLQEKGIGFCSHLKFEIKI